MIGVSANAITSANFLLIQGKMKSPIAHAIQKDDRTSTNFKRLGKNLTLIHTFGRATEQADLKQK